VPKGIAELYRSFREHGFTSADFEGDRYFRLRHIKKLQDERRLDGAMRWRQGPPAMQLA
jgi:hypothetical protein